MVDKGQPFSKSNKHVTVYMENSIFQHSLPMASFCSLHKYIYFAYNFDANVTEFIEHARTHARMHAYSKKKKLTQIVNGHKNLPKFSYRKDEFYFYVWMRRNEIDLGLFFFFLFLFRRTTAHEFRMKVLRFVGGVKFYSYLEQLHTVSLSCVFMYTEKKMSMRKHVFQRDGKKNYVFLRQCANAGHK